MRRPASWIGLWALALLGCLAVVAVSTRFSREMTVWAIIASVLLLTWLWLQLSRPKAGD
jgi:hypothetical protein